MAVVPPPLHAGAAPGIGTESRGSYSYPVHNAQRGGGACPVWRAIDHHWKVMSPRVKAFVLGQGHLAPDGGISLERLIGFWSSPHNIDATGRVEVCAAMWSLVRYVDPRRIFYWVFCI